MLGKQYHNTFLISVYEIEILEKYMSREQLIRTANRIRQYQLRDC
jgi:hypothetical protein